MLRCVVQLRACQRAKSWVVAGSLICLLFFFFFFFFHFSFFFFLFIFHFLNYSFFHPPPPHNRWVFKEFTDNSTPLSKFFLSIWRSRGISFPPPLPSLSLLNSPLSLLLLFPSSFLPFFSSFPLPPPPSFLPPPFSLFSLFSLFSSLPFFSSFSPLLRLSSVF